MKNKAQITASQVTFNCPKCGEKITDKKPRYIPWAYENESLMESDAGIDVIVSCPKCNKTFEGILL